MVAEAEKRAGPPPHRGRSPRAALGLALLALAALLAAPAARADFGVAKWEAGTCKADLPECTYASPESQFYTQLAGRPPAGITDFEFNLDGLGNPEGAVRTVRVDLPPGLSVNPEAAPKCSEAELTADPLSTACLAKGAQVGTVRLTALKLIGLIPVDITLPVFNIVPRPGIPAQFGFYVNIPLVADFPVYLEGTVSWEGDYHEGFTIRGIPADLPPVRNRLVFNGRAGNGSFITVGSDCGGSTTTGLTVDSHQAPGAYLHYATTPILPKRAIAPSGCERVPFDPSVAADLGTRSADSPTGAAIELRVPFRPGEEIGRANVKRAHVSLPPGMGLNPAAAPGLAFCADAEFGKGIAIGDRIAAPGAVHPPPIACPPQSRIGSVAVETPVLPAGSLRGAAYLGRQLSRDPASGKLYRLFVAAESPRFGVFVRLVGEVSADPASGRLTARFDEPSHGGLPQVPFSSFQVSLDGGRGVLSSPPTCGPNVTATALAPWTGAPPARPASAFQLSSAPGGGPCAATMAARPFAPGFAAGPRDNRARRFSPFAVHLTRPPGQQELREVDIVLPPGATARLKGVPYCPPAAIAAAAARSGAEERRDPSCPAKSRVGSATVLAGTGGSPLRIGGEAYLAGAAGGASLSLVVVTPALAGPFDLGNVVVRVPLHLEPRSARIHPVARVPDVFGGAKLSLRSVAVDVDRRRFTLNGTNCRRGAVAGVLRGGGADPADPAAWSSVGVSAPFRARGCKRLKFRPRLNLRLSGPMQRNKNPRLRAILRARKGDANIRRVAVALPHSLFLDQASLARVCTRVQFAAGECPKRSIYGRARAFSPLLGKPLEGPLYLRSSDNPLPDLVAHLKGQVTIELVGRIDSHRGGIRTTFTGVPDVPVRKFNLVMRGGRRGLLVASTNLCRAAAPATVRFKAQNGKRLNKRVRLRAPCSQKRSRGQKAGRRG